MVVKGVKTVRLWRMNPIEIRKISPILFIKPSPQDYPSFRLKVLKTENSHF